VDVTGLLEDDYKIVEKLFKRFEKAAGLSGGSRYLRRKKPGLGLRCGA